MNATQRIISDLVDGFSQSPPDPGHFEALGFSPSEAANMSSGLALLTGDDVSDEYRRGVCDCLAVVQVDRGR